ncbi:MAG TPA: exodeoxyribonuclease VII large subunit [Planctomycetota bacterium]|nr:exodeoxyribonuclease VII large subunit [Planctomycetota bacterium]
MPAPDDPDLFEAFAGATEASPKLWTVGELTREIKSALEELGRIRVEGEVTRVVRAASGHVYFDLKDIDAKISCTIWRSQVASAVRFDLAEGAQVVAHGRLDVYGPRGTYSLNVQRLEQAGLGALLLRLEKLKEELKALGWFDRKRALPAMPAIVGVVTSRDGAALQDFLRTRSLRWPLYPVRLAHTSVQGAGAAEEIAAAIRRLDATGVDVIVVCRGGGSLEDLWAFNERAVAEAIRAASVPVVTGVGHETDVTLADLVADHRGHTPTDAAQTVIPDRAVLLEELDRARNHLLQAIDGVLADRAERLARVAASPTLRGAGFLLDRRTDALAHHAHSLRLAGRAVLERANSRLARGASRLSRQSPALRLEKSLARVAACAPRLARAIDAPLADAARRLEVAHASLAATSPFAVLERGYSITTRAGGTAALRDPADLAAGEKIQTVLASGWILSEIEKTGVEKTGDTPA